jgi:hypothetical protein
MIDIKLQNNSFENNGYGPNTVLEIIPRPFFRENTSSEKDLLFKDILNKQHAKVGRNNHQSSFVYDDICMHICIYVYIDLLSPDPSPPPSPIGPSGDGSVSSHPVRGPHTPRAEH